MNKNGTLSNLLWKFAERMSAQIVTFVVSVVLARLLDPSDYGAIAMVNVFIAIANVFVSDGLGSALIQKKNADSLDFSSVLYFNIGLSIVLYVVLFFCAPFISVFYGEGYEILTPVLRVLGLKLILASINSVQQAYVSRNMIFRKFFWATFVGTVLSAVVGIVMAYQGFGIWALVGQYLTNSTVDTIVLGISLKKKPLLRFSFERVKTLAKYGIHILGTGLLIESYTNIRNLIVGKIYSSDSLAYYNKGDQFPSLFVTNINSSISAVIFPRLSQEQDNPDKVKELMRSFIRLSMFIMSPLLIGLAGIAKPLVTVLLTEKWLPCVFFLQVFCLNHLLRPVHTANIQATKAIGRSDITLKVEFIKKTVEIVSLLLVMRMSVEAIAINMVLMSFLFVAVNAYPNQKLIGYSIGEQIKDMLPSLLMSGIMFGCISLIGLLDISNIGKLFLQITMGFSVYLLISIVTNNREYHYCINLLKTFVNHRSHV